MQVYLIQHGLAVPKETDPERPLSEEGRADVTALARFLAGRGVDIPLLRHSPKRRAQQTAELLAEAVGGRCVASDGLTPNDPVEPWPAQLASAEGDVALVSHLPFVGRLATRLLAEREEPAAVAFVPGAALCLASDSGVWAVQWMVHPALSRHA